MLLLYQQRHLHILDHLPLFFCVFLTRAQPDVRRQLLASGSWPAGRERLNKRRIITVIHCHIRHNVSTVIFHSVPVRRYLSRWGSLNQLTTYRLAKTPVATTVSSIPKNQLLNHSPPSLLHLCHPSQPQLPAPASLVNRKSPPAPPREPTACTRAHRLILQAK